MKDIYTDPDLDGAGFSGITQESISGTLGKIAKSFGQTNSGLRAGVPVTMLYSSSHMLPTIYMRGKITDEDFGDLYWQILVKHMSASDLRYLLASVHEDGRKEGVEENQIAMRQALGLQ